jgi:carboxylesterase
MTEILSEFSFFCVLTVDVWRQNMLKNEPFLLEADDEQVCLLLHGLGGGAYEMQLLDEYLHRKGLSVQTINYPGHDHPAPRMPASTW